MLYIPERLPAWRTGTSWRASWASGATARPAPEPVRNTPGMKTAHAVAEVAELTVRASTARPRAMTISNSGEYLHQGAGEYYCLGKANCSHGCVRQSPKDAVWLYRTVQPGDVVEITGSRRKLEWNNGWSFWQLDWESWKRGSSLQ
ncbi:L,D-transpeptidase [Spirillospora sp. CA-108201]